MTKQERLSLKIANKERIILSYGSIFFKLLAIIIFVICLISVISFSYFFKNSIERILFASCISLFYVAFLVHLRKYVSASIQGEMFLTESIYKKHKITSIQSIRSISSKTFFNINYTKVTYKLDGCTRRVRMVKIMNSEKVGNEEIIRMALETTV